MADPIASTDLKLVRPTGETIDVAIRIFPPSTSEQNATCGVELVGLFDGIHNIHGHDTFQALALALHFVRKILDGEESKGDVIHIADTDGTEPPYAGYQSESNKASLRSRLAVVNTVP